MKSNLRLTAMLLLFTILTGVPGVWALEFPPTAAEQPGELDAAYGNRPVSFQVFLRFRPGKAAGHHSQ